MLEDLMDLTNAKRVVGQLESGELRIEEQFTSLPSPFAFNIVLLGRTDMLKMEDRQEFLKRMHRMVLAKIELDKGRKNES